MNFSELMKIAFWIETILLITFRYFYVKFTVARESVRTCTSENWNKKSMYIKFNIKFGVLEISK